MLKNPNYQLLGVAIMFLIMALIASFLPGCASDNTSSPQALNSNKWQVRVIYCDQRQPDTITVTSEHKPFNSDIHNAGAVPYFHDDILSCGCGNSNDGNMYYNVCAIQTIKHL